MSRYVSLGLAAGAAFVLSQLAVWEVAAAQRTTLNAVLTDGFEVRALAFLPTEASTRQTGQPTPDAVLLTLQKGTAVVICYYTLGAYVSDEVGEIESCKVHAPEAVAAEAPAEAKEDEKPAEAAATPEPDAKPEDDQEEAAEKLEEPAEAAKEDAEETPGAAADAEPEKPASDEAADDKAEEDAPAPEAEEEEEKPASDDPPVSD